MRPEASRETAEKSRAAPEALVREVGATWKRLTLGPAAAGTTAAASDGSPREVERQARRGLDSPSAPLDPARRQRFEHRFGADFSQVRVHDGPAARDSAQGLGAIAYARGKDIVLGAPEEGGHSTRVLAHELAHVVQQSAAPTARGTTPLAVGSPADQIERSADRAAERAMGPDRSPVTAGHADTAGVIRRKPKAKGVTKGKGTGAPAPQKPSEAKDKFEPFYLPPMSAVDCAKVGGDLAAGFNDGAKVQTHFVLVIITDAVYLYTPSGKLIQTFAITGPQPVLGIFLGGGLDDTLQVRVDPAGNFKLVEIGGWGPDVEVQISKWTTLSGADQSRYIGDQVPIIMAPGFPAAAAATATTQPPSKNAPNPNAVPGATAAREGKGESLPDQQLEQALSGSEYDVASGRDVANYPAFPASIRKPSGLVAVGGLNELTMHLDWTYGESSLIGAVWNASTRVRYHWERWDVSAIVKQGAEARKAEAKRRTQAPLDPGATAEDEFSSHDRQERLRTLGEDVSGSVETIQSGGDPNASPMERMKSVQTEWGNLQLAPVSAIKSAGGHLLDSVWHWATKPDNEINLQWKSEGTFLIRCIASPSEHEGRKYLPSVATEFVEARPADYLARDTLHSAETAIVNKQIDLALAKDPATIRRLRDEISEMEVAAFGSATDALRIAVGKKKAEVDAAIGRAKVRRGDELKALEKQLAIAERNESNMPAGPDGKPAHALRPQASFASRVTGSTYPLLLQLVPISQGGRPRWALYDVTVKGDKLGHAYVGQGNTDESAIDHAFRQFAGDNDYGRGMLVYRIPDSIPNVSVRLNTLKNVHRGDALARDRLNDLLVVLVALSLVVPGVGQVAMVLGAGLAAQHILERWRNGNLEADASLVTDLVMILGAIGGGAAALAELRVVRASKAFTIAADTGDLVKLESSIAKLEGALTTAKAVQIGNEIIGYGGLMWGNIETLDAIQKINEDEAEGKITHSEARLARAHAVLGAIQNHALMFAGPLEAARKSRAALDEPGAPAAPREPGPPAGEVPKPGEPSVVGVDAPAAPAPPAGGAGAVRGRDTYPLRTGPSDKPLEVKNPDVQDQMIIAADASKTRGEAEIHPAGSGGHYRLDVAGKGGNPAVEVKVTLEIVPALDPTSGPHGGEEGHARLDLVRTGGKWEATIRIHEMVRKTDVSRIAGHEIEEIVEIIRRADPSVPDTEATANAQHQMRAEVFRPGPPSRKPPTAHDLAAARELATAYADLHAATATKNTVQRDLLRRRIEAMRRSMGLEDPVGGRERAKALEDLGVLAPDTANRVRAEVEATRAAARTGPSAGTILDAGVVEHVFRTEATKADSFARDGLGGGHVHSELQAFLAANRGTYRLTLEALKVGGDGATYRVYRQEMVDPASGKTITARDGSKLLYKTTSSSPDLLLDSGLTAFDHWVVAESATSGPPGSFGGKMNGRWSGVGPHGVEFEGFATFDGTNWHIDTLYPKAAWIFK